MAHNIYFIGIGGIGMSAIARHYRTNGRNVAGYDKTRSRLTAEIESEGIAVTYDDDVATIPESFRDVSDTMVIVTPAIPSDNAILNYFRSGGFRIEKRSVALGELTRPMKSICVAGTHGKTTTSTLAAHILRESNVGCSAFLGGISVNYGTNYWSDLSSKYVVTEADEYDRSFLQLEPDMAVITAMDADHLDIYGTHAEVIKAFKQFAGLVRHGGMLLAKAGLDLKSEDLAAGVELRTYTLDDSAADYYARDIQVRDGRYEFSVVGPGFEVDGIRMGLPGRHNIENCVAAVAMARRAGATDDDIRRACKSFRGNRRRFEIHVERADAMLIDDYAHHPEEIRATLRSVRELYPGRRVTVAFQPHLYTRTRDLAPGFASALSMADRVWMLDIYPAREKPIAGVSSDMLLELMEAGVGRKTTKERLASDIMSEEHDIVVVMGAGDIDRLVGEIEQKMTE